MRLLVVESETADEREERRASAGKSAGETFAATLEQMFPGAATDRVTPSDGEESSGPQSGSKSSDGRYWTGTGAGMLASWTSSRSTGTAGALRSRR